ncbi:MAG: type II secretion system GspH family protein, partial [Bdellovibrionales bacterium]|nr:type II secretion system GspH family protein [Bdellovibrionales bacterium]
MRSPRGFSLGEVLISVALLGIVATMSTQMIVGTFNSIGRQESKGQCTHVAQSVISMIDRLGTRDRVLAPIVPGVNFQAGTESSVLNAQVQPSEQFLLPVWFPQGSTPPLVTTEGGFIRVNNAQLIVSSINLVQNFYNQNPASCTNREGTSIIDQLRISQTPLPTNTLDIRLKINPYDLTSQGAVNGTTCPTPPLLVSPQRFDKKVNIASQGQANDQTTEGFIWGADSSIGFNVSVNVTMRGSDRNETCTFQKSFYHDRDQSNPTGVATPEAPTSADGVGLWTQIGPSQFIGPGMNSIEIPIHFSSLEKGSVILCGDPVADGSRLKDCASIDLTPVGGGPTRRPASVRWDNRSVATFQFTGLPPNKVYKIAMAAIDTSGNRTPQFAAEFEARPCTGEVINPANCPLEVDCPLSVDPAYPSNARISCTGTTAAAISRYGAVLSALKYRNQPVCIETPNF